MNGSDANTLSPERYLTELREAEANIRALVTRAWKVVGEVRNATPASDETVPPAWEFYEDSAKALDDALTSVRFAIHNTRQGMVRAPRTPAPI